MQRHKDGLAFITNNVCRIVVVLVVGLHHIENDGLHLAAGGAPRAGELIQQIHSIFLPDGEPLALLLAEVELRHGGGLSRAFVRSLNSDNVLGAVPQQGYAPRLEFGGGCFPL